MSPVDLLHSDAHRLEQRLLPLHEETDEHDLAPITFEELHDAAWALVSEAESPPPADALRVLDDIYRYRTVRLLKSRFTDREDLGAFLAHLEKMAPAWLRDKMDDHDIPFGTRWQTLRSILSVRLDELNAQKPHHAFISEHDRLTAAIVLDSGGLPRRELYTELLAKNVRRSQGWLTQRLIALEAIEWVERQSRKGTLWVMPGVRLVDHEEELRKRLSSSKLSNESIALASRRVPLAQVTFGAFH